MKKLWIITFCGVLLKIFLSLSTFHSDMQVFALAGGLVASGNILNLYDFSSSAAVLNYPPAIYIFHGIFAFLFKLLGLSVINQFNINLLLLKLPYLIFDLSVGFILLKLFNFSKKGVWAFTIWMFNPINLYATYMMGQFDIIPAFFIILSVLLSSKGKLKFAALALGGGIAFKLSPIFLVVPLIILGKDLREKFKLLLIAMVPYLITIFPYIFSRSFRSTALFANQSSKSLYAGIPVSGGESILLFPAFLLLFYLIIWSLRIKINIARLFSIPLLLFFIFTHYHPQWLIWIIPILIFELVSSEFRDILPYLLILVTWFISLFFFDPSLTVGIFAPVVPQLQNLPSIWTLLKINIDVNGARSLIQTVFSSAAFFLIYQYFPKKQDE